MNHTMKNILRSTALILGVLLTLPFLGQAQAKKTPSSVATPKSTTSNTTGHSIQITLKPYQNAKIYLGTNYGNSRVLADSTLLNEKSEGVFESKNKLTPGIYFVVSPKYAILFDFLVDDAQHFKIIADTFFQA